MEVEVEVKFKLGERSETLRKVASSTAGGCCREAERARALKKRQNRNGRMYKQVVYGNEYVFNSQLFIDCALECDLFVTGSISLSFFSPYTHSYSSCLYLE
jgi:hypothetical protein